MTEYIDIALSDLVFNSNGLVALDILQAKTTITAKYYAEEVPPKVVNTIC